MRVKHQNVTKNTNQKNQSKIPRTSMKKRIPWFLIAFLLIPCFVQAQNLRDDLRVKSAINLLEMWVQAQVDFERIAGVSMSVVHDQELIWASGFGYSDIESKKATTERTIYSICSISKLFTSVGMLQLRDRGLLRLDDPVKKHLSWFDIKQQYEHSPPITIEGLLTHSSGLPREADFPYWTEASFPTREQMIDHLSEQETLYPARKQFQYSNLGLSLAGEIIAKVSGKPYAEYIKENILEPLGLTDTTPDIPIEKQKGQLATGYGSFKRDGTRPVMPFYTVNGIAPAAGFASTVVDLGKFASWQFRILENNGNELLAANTLRDMHRVHWLNQDWTSRNGLGFAVWRDKETTFVGHGGSCPGYLSHLLLQPEEKFASVFMTNSRSLSSRMYTQMAYDILAPIIKEVLKSPDKAKTPNPEWEMYTGLYERPLGGESHVIFWQGELATISLPTENPMRSLTKLKHEKGHVFRRVRDDGEEGTPVTFEVDENGKVIRMWSTVNYSIKIH